MSKWNSVFHEMFVAGLKFFIKTKRKCFNLKLQEVIS